MPQRAGSKARPCLSSFIFLPFGASSVLVHDPPALRLGCLRHQLAISQAAPPRRDAQGNQLHIRHPCPSSLYLSPAGRGQSVTARLFPGVGGQYPSSIASKLSNSWVLYWPGNHLSSRTSMGTDQTGATCWVLTRTRNRRAGASHSRDVTHPRRRASRSSSRSPAVSRLVHPLMYWASADRPARR